MQNGLHCYGVVGVISNCRPVLISDTQGLFFRV